MALKFAIPIYGFQVSVLVESPPEALKWLRRYFVIDDDVDEKWMNQIDGSVFQYNTIKGGYGRFIVYINRDSFKLKICDERYLWEVVTHEVYHLTTNVLEYAKVAATPDECEAHAYLHGWLCGKILPFVYGKWKMRKK